MRLAAIALALLPFAAQAQPDARDIAVAKQLSQEVERQSTPLTDAVVVDYVTRIARKVAQAADFPPSLTVKVIDADTSFAYPGPSLYIDANAILRAAGEAELAAVIAHLLGHLVQWRSEPLATVGQDQIFSFWRGGCMRELRTLVVPVALARQEIIVEAKSDELGLGFLAQPVTIQPLWPISTRAWLQSTSLRRCTLW
jgi:hypothetical protein